MKAIELDYGTNKMPLEVPDSAVVVRYGETYSDRPSVDPVAATCVARSLTPASSHGLGPELGDQDGGSCGSARRPMRNVA